MDCAFVHVKEADYNNKKSSENHRFSRLRVELKLEVLLLSSIGKSISYFCIQKLCIRLLYGLNKKLPKQIKNLEENFIHYCIELNSYKCIKRKFMEYSQGTLHCSWKDGFPHYVFNIAGKRRVFITTELIKVESGSDKGVDYVYMFYFRELDLLGKMSVCTSFELCPHGTQIMETKFVLCVNGDDIEGYMHTLDKKQEKNKGLSKKSTISKNRSNKQRFSVVQENMLEPKLELAAIVVKNHILESQKEVEVGGWGLKFLRKDRHCVCKKNTSMNVLVPAGFHSGPRTGKGGGPSTLVERWRNGGSCDCGGWDLGCPLTVFHAGLNHQGHSFGENGSFDLYVQGCKQSVPVFKMVDLRDGLYNIRYKSILSPLQSLSVAVAAIHSRSPTLEPRAYTN